MINLLEETIEVLEENDKKLEDIVWIGSEDGFITKDLFIELADISYSSGFGSPDIADDLLIVGEDWWLERGEYDGSEWWDFKSLPEKPKEELKIIRLNGGMWTSLSQMQYESNY